MNIIKNLLIAIISISLPISIGVGAIHLMSSSSEGTGSTSSNQSSTSFLGFLKPISKSYNSVSKKSSLPTIQSTPILTQPTTNKLSSLHTPLPTPSTIQIPIPTTTLDVPSKPVSTPISNSLTTLTSIPSITPIPTNLTNNENSQTVINIELQSADNIKSSINTSANNEISSTAGKFQNIENTITQNSGQIIQAINNQETAIVSKVEAQAVINAGTFGSSEVASQITTAKQPFETAISNFQTNTQNSINQLQSYNQTFIDQINTNLQENNAQIDLCINSLNAGLTCTNYNSLYYLPNVTLPSLYIALCNDYTYSLSQNNQGTCSSHEGVAEWF